MAEQQKQQMMEMSRSFDPASFQREKEASYGKMKAMDPKLAHTQEMNEIIMQDAKKTGNQGNLTMGPGYRMVVRSDDEMGGDAGKYWWGQNEGEVILKYRAPDGTKSRDVKLTTTSTRIKLVVGTDVVCDGPLFANIISDDTIFEVTDLAESLGGGRLVTVTLVKAKRTSASKHWSCAVRGEGVIDTKAFGPPVVTVNPFDRKGMADAVSTDAGED